MDTSSLKKIKLYHLLLKDDKDPYRQLVSIASLNKLSNLFEYEQLWNFSYKKKPPKETFFYPDIYDKIPITPAHYGCFLAFKEAILHPENDNYDAIIICEADCLLRFGHKLVEDRIYKALDFCEQKDINYFSFGSRFALDTGIIQSIASEIHNEFHIVENIIGIQMIMFTKKGIDILKKYYKNNKWHGSDIFFSHAFNKKGIYTTSLTTQVSGFSTIENKERKYFFGDMALYRNLLDNNNINLIPKNILEIGSRDGDHAEELRYYFDIDESNVFIVEPNENTYEQIEKKYPKAKLIKKAIFNQSHKEKEFYQVNSDDKNLIGMSGLLYNPLYELDHYKTKKVKVETTTGKNLLKEINQKSIDLCKIDVEGATYEVLESFGDEIDKIKTMHIETEECQIWKNQKTDKEVSALLMNKGFLKIHETIAANIDKTKNQLDQIWVNKKIVRNINAFPKQSNNFQRLKIAFVVDHLSTGGMPAYVLQQAEVCKSHGHISVVIEVSNLSGDLYNKHYDELKKISRIIRLDDLKNGKSKNQNIIEIIRDSGAELIYFHDVIPDGDLYSFVNSKDRLFNTVLTIHSSTFEWEKLSWDLDRIVTVSDWQQKKVQESCQCKDVVKIEYSPWKPTCEEEKFVRRNKFRKKFNIPDETKVILHVGLWAPWKNQSYILDLAEKMDDKLFMFVGNQAINFKDYWEPLKLKLRNNTLVMGEQGEDFIQHALCGCDAFIFPSTMELYPISLLEAISSMEKVFANPLKTYEGLSGYNPLSMDLESDVKTINSIL